MDISKKIQEKLKEFLSKWCVADNNRKLYGFDMPQAKKSREQLHAELKNVLPALGEISVVKKDGELEVVGKDWVVSLSELGAKGVEDVIVSSFEKLNMDSITFYSGITSLELDELFLGLNKSLDELDKIKGLQGYLQSKGVKHVKANQLHFELLKEGEDIGVKDKTNKSWSLDDKPASGASKASGGVWGLDDESSDSGQVASGGHQKSEEHKIDGKNFSSFWKEYLSGKLGKNAVVGMFAEFIESAKDNPAQLANTLRRITTKQKDIESFLADLERKLSDLGFNFDEIAEIKEKLIKTKKVAVSEEELLRLRKLEKDFESTLEERVEGSLREIKKINQKLTKEKERVTTILRQNSQGVIVISKEGKILSMNGLAQKALGVSLKEGQQKALKDIINKDQTLSLTSDWHKETEDFTPDNVEVTASDSQVRDMISESSTIVENEDGKAVGLLASLQGKILRQQLEDRKNEMLDVLGHDLRAPIVAAKQNLSVLFEATDFLKNLNEDQKNMVSLCHKNIEKMEKMVATILDARQLETGKIILRKTETNLADLLQEAVNLLKSWADSKKIKLSANIEGSCTLSVDPERVYQVVNNLISNALKFTPPGGAVDVKLGAVKDKCEDVKVSIIDSGIGIKDDDMTRIFNKYEQVGLKSPQGASGLGLGLAICKSIIEMHGGRIWAESKNQAGSSFIFTLPITKKSQS
jgi:signal transduction histidine kinase